MGICCSRGRAGFCRVASIYCCTKTVCCCCKRRVVSACAPCVRPTDYPNWPGWNWSDDAALRKLLESVDDGDVLLMCSSHSYGEFARALANSKWDHCAMVVRHRPRKKAMEKRTSRRITCLQDKYPGLEKYHKVSNPDLDKDFDASEPSGDPLQDVELFESTGDGVHVYNLVERLRNDPKMFDRYRIIALRKLECERTAQMLSELDDVIAEFRGLPFKQQRADLETAVLRSGSKARNVASIFCPELCAECYQAMGILSLDRPSNDYLPCDWSTENSSFGVRLEGEAALGAEMIIKAPRLGPEPQKIDVDKE